MMKKDYVEIERVHMEEDTGKSSHEGTGELILQLVPFRFQ